MKPSTDQVACTDPDCGHWLTLGWLGRGAVATVLAAALGGMPEGTVWVAGEHMIEHQRPDRMLLHVPHDYYPDED